jgi:hypothetical protein
MCCALAALLVSTGAALAAPDPEPMVTDRPTDGVSPIVVPKGAFQFEAGYKYSRSDTDNGGVDEHTFPDFLFRYGLGERFEARLFTSGWNAREEAGETEANFADITLGTKIELTEPRGRFGITSLLVDISLPTGADSETSDYVIPKVLLVGGYELSDCYSLTYNIGPSLVTFKENGARDTRWDLNYALALGAVLRSNVDLFAEVYGNVQEGSSPETSNLQVGSTINVSPTFQLDVRVGAGLVSAAPDWFAGAGLAYRLP